MSKIRKKLGLPPGSVVFTGNQKVERVQIHHLKYNTDELFETTLDNHSDIVFHRAEPNLNDWYDIRGIHDEELIKTIGDTFNLHPLILEDIVDTQQRPKFDEYDSGIFLIVKAIRLILIIKFLILKTIHEILLR